MSSTKSVTKKQRCHLQTEIISDAGQLERKETFHQLKSLFQICTEFIAKNLHLVDSLVGFPDIVGHKIFQCAKGLQKFSTASKDSLLAMELFCEAYEESVMNCLSLRSCHLGIADYLDQVCLFRHLSELDIGHCGLGDDHELLQHISNCYSLRKLGLCDNALTDAGIQKLTTPLRMFLRGPTNLNLLDLSENPDITYCVARFLRIFKLLTKLNLTGTSIKAGHISYVEEKLCMKSDLEACPKDNCLTKNQGWAGDVVSEWMSQCSRRVKVVKPKSDTSKFYQRTSVFKKMLTEKTDQKPNLREQPVIYLVKKSGDVSNSHTRSLNKNKSGYQTREEKLGDAKIKIKTESHTPRIFNHFASENSTLENQRVKAGNAKIKSDRNLLVSKSLSRRPLDNGSECDSTILSLYNSSDASKSGVEKRSLAAIMEEW